MDEVKDVWVCMGGCGERRIGKPSERCECGSRNGWCCHESHGDKCTQHMCRETEKWLQRQ